MSELQETYESAIAESGGMLGSHLVRGTAGYRRVSLAMFLCGLGTFSLLYSVQPLMPLMAGHYQIDPATSSLALSLATAALALSLFPAAAIAERFGRCKTICYALTAAAMLHIAGAMMPSWSGLLLCRTIEGLFLGGVPAVAMTYLSEEIHPSHLGTSLGLYISGNAVGGIGGRFISGFLADWFSWTSSLAMVGVIGLVMAVGLHLLLPPSRNFAGTSSPRMLDHVLIWLSLLKDRRVSALAAIGLLNMAGFVTVYNYISFYLLSPPFHLGTAEIGLFFTVYFFGIAASWASGHYGGRAETRLVALLKAASLIACLGVAMTCSSSLAVVAAGTAVLTIGFFVVHSSASTLIARSTQHARGHASSLYLHTYYVGASVGGTLGGLFWMPFGWSGIALYAIALFASARLAARWVSSEIKS